MSMSYLAPLTAVGALVAAFAATPADAQQDAVPAVKDYTVFVDPPSAYAYIKLPMGWKFIGKLDAEQMRHLPQGTVTSLLPPEGDGVNLASERQVPTATAKQ